MYTFFIGVCMCIYVDIREYIRMCLYVHTHTRPGRPAYVCTNSTWILKTSSINFNFQGWLMTVSQQRNYLSFNSRHQGPSTLSLELLGFHTTFYLKRKEQKPSKLKDIKRHDPTARWHRQHSKTEKNPLSRTRRLSGDRWARAMCCFLKDIDPNIKGLNKH